MLCRDASTKIIDPDGRTKESTATCVKISSQLILSSENCNWHPLKKEVFAGNTTCNQVLSFTNAQIINYFVIRNTMDGMPANDMKAIDNSALNLFCCRHIQDIKVCTDQHLAVQADCVPEMRKDRIYKLCLHLDTVSFDIISARCGCPTGKGPHASCKHVAAVCYALEEFSRFRQLPDFLACTDKLQEWNRSRPKKLDIIHSCCKLTFKKARNLKKKAKENSPSPSCYDPHPQEYRQVNLEAVEKLRCDFLSLSQPCAFLDILVTSVDKVMHDHSYSLPPAAEDSINRVDNNIIPSIVSGSDLPDFPMDEEFSTLCSDVGGALNISLCERARIEVSTQNQSLQQGGMLRGQSGSHAQDVERFFARKRSSTSTVHISQTLGSSSCTYCLGTSL